MTSHTLRRLLNRRPFEPMRITTADGASIDVRRPEMALLTRSAMIVSYPDIDGGLSDSIEFIFYLHIDSVETASGLTV